MAYRRVTMETKRGRVSVKFWVYTVLHVVPLCGRNRDNPPRMPGRMIGDHNIARSD
jgi:hypothetical protein